VLGGRTNAVARLQPVQGPRMLSSAASGTVIGPGVLDQGGWAHRGTAALGGHVRTTTHSGLGHCKRPALQAPEPPSPADDAALVHTILHRRMPANHPSADSHLHRGRHHLAADGLKGRPSLSNTTLREGCLRPAILARAPRPSPGRMPLHNTIKHLKLLPGGGTWGAQHRHRPVGLRSRHRPQDTGHGTLIRPWGIPAAFERTVTKRRGGNRQINGNTAHYRKPSETGTPARRSPHATPRNGTTHRQITLIGGVPSDAGISRWGDPGAMRATTPAERGRLALRASAAQ